jgi:hypothetical protein
LANSLLKGSEFQGFFVLMTKITNKRRQTVCASLALRLAPLYDETAKQTEEFAGFVNSAKEV